jgi:hypothetical protein
VSIGTDHSQYASKDTLHVTVINHTQRAIYAWDTKASCSVLELELQTSAGWNTSPEAVCAIKRAAAPVKIEPGATYSATIRAALPAGGDAAFPAGSYRLTLAYRTSDSSAASEPTAVVYSASLTVGGASTGGHVPEVDPMGTPRAK